MTQLLQILVAGLVAGSVYAVIALGFTLIFNVSGVVNLAQGDFFIVGALVALGLTEWTDMPLWLAALIAVAVAALVGLALERFIIRPARNAAIAIILVLTVGVSMIIQGVLLVVYGGDAKALPPFGSQKAVTTGGVKFIPQDFWLFGFVALVAVGLVFFLRRTHTGIAMRATSMSSFGAAVTGINTSVVRMLAFAVSGGLGAAAAIFAAPITFVTYDGGTMLGLKAFVAAVLGGLGRPGGAIAGGLGLGVIEALSGGYISSLYADVITFGILLATLVYRSFRKREATGPTFVVRSVFTRLPEGRWRWSVSGVAVVAGLLLPLLLTDGYTTSLVTLVVLYATVLLGLDLLRGYTGMLSLGHAAFMGIGAYSTAILTTAHGWPSWAALLVALPVSAVVAALFAWTCVRLSGYNLALATLGFAVIFEGLMRGLTSLTGGSSGVGGIGDFSIFGMTFTSLRSQLYLVLVIFGLLYAWSRAVIRRQPGRMMKAVHSDELAARSLGVNPSRVKTKVFVLSAVIASAMGSLYAHFQHFVSPDQFGLTVSLLLLTMLVIGGEGTLWGAVIGVVVLRIIPEYFSAFADYQLLIEGVLLTGVLLLFPAGAAGGLTRLANAGWDAVAKRRPPRGTPAPAPETQGVPVALVGQEAGR